jgi:hypothetical protein
MFLMLLIIVDAKITTEDSESISRLNCKKGGDSLAHGLIHHVAAIIGFL